MESIQYVEAQRCFDYTERNCKRPFISSVNGVIFASYMSPIKELMFVSPRLIFLNCVGNLVTEVVSRYSARSGEAAMYKLLARKQFNHRHTVTEMLSV